MNDPITSTEELAARAFWARVCWGMAPAQAMREIVGVYGPVVASSVTRLNRQVFDPPEDAATYHRALRLAWVGVIHQIPLEERHAPAA